MCPRCEVPYVEGRYSNAGVTVGWFEYCALCDYTPDDEDGDAV
jgi:hypothetical protein